MLATSSNLFEGFGNVLVFGVFGAIFVWLNLFVIGKVLLRRPHKPDQGQKQETFECGEPALGDAWIRFDIRFYTIALIFLIFDIEVTLLFPWAVAFGDFIDGGHGVYAFLVMTVFLVILAIGLAFDWLRRDLEWTSTKPGPAIPEESLTGPATYPAPDSAKAAAETTDDQPVAEETTA